MGHNAVMYQLSATVSMIISRNVNIKELKHMGFQQKQNWSLLNACDA